MTDDSAKTILRALIALIKHEDTRMIDFVALAERAELVVPDLLDSITRLTRDLRKAAATLSDAEARFLVDIYYQMQDQRIRGNNQVRAQEDEPHSVLLWFAEQADTLEKQIKGALLNYVKAHPIGPWALETVGVGPVISAGIIARIDIHKAPTVGHIWRFAGLDPTSHWGKGEKRPWNADLKRICWLLGESFVKVSGNLNAFYGHIYRERKAMEIARNADGYNREVALERAKKVGKDTDAWKSYSVGLLPPAHIHARAKRYAVKLWLAHLHQAWWEKATGTPAPLPYAIAQLGHAHKIEPPH